jgi:hypothetical protein
VCAGLHGCIEIREQGRLIDEDKSKQRNLLTDESYVNPFYHGKTDA